MIQNARHNANECQVALNLQLAMREEATSMLGTVLLIVLIIMLIGALPTWPHSRSWGYYPSGGLGTVLLIVLILVLLGHI